MASKILLKKSTTASSVPTTLALDVGEVAINTEDKRLFTKDSGGSIVEVSTTPSTMDVDGNATVGGTLNVTGTTTAGTVNATNVTVSGTLTVPTPTSDTDAASKGYVDTEVSTAVANVIDASPAALDTLNELAAALGDDPNFSTTITTSIGTKLPKDGSEAMTGNLNLNSNHIVNVSDPSNVGDAANKNYVDTRDALKLNLSGGTMTGDITMGANSVTSTATPSTDDTLTRKGYVDSILGSATSAATSASEAAASASAAATSASNASTSESNAATSAASAAASYDDFDDRYLGPKATAPALDNDGDALVAGALYFDTTVGAMYVYDGSTWDQVAITVSDVLTVNNNLSDLQSAATALTNLGITATATELNYVDGVTSNIQTQIDAIDPDPTKGTLTKTFANGEQASITLSSAVSTAPVVTVTKEVAQTGVSSKGAWDVNSTGSNYELHDTAYATTLTPGSIQDWTTPTELQSFSVASEETNVTDVSFNADGTELYIIGNGNDNLRKYTLSTAYDLTSTVTLVASKSVSSQDVSPRSFTFNNDGTKFFMCGFGGSVHEYTMSTAYDIGNASFSQSKSVSTNPQYPTGIRFNNDGTKMFLVGNGTAAFYEWSLSTAFDVSTATYTTSYDTTSDTSETNAHGMHINSDGTEFYIVHYQNGIYKFTASTAYDISTLTYDSIVSNLFSIDTSIAGFSFANDANTFVISGGTGDKVYKISISKDALVLGSGSFASTDVGKRIVGNGGEAILTAADGSYSVVTAFTDSSTIASGSWSMYALDVDATNGITLSSRINGFDITNASYDSVSFSVASQDTSPSSFAFNNDGTKMYVVGNSGDDVNQYTLSTAYDLSTASFDSVIFSVASQETAPQGLTFNNDGTKMYIVGTGTDTVYQYSLSTAFDLSTASYDSQSANVTSQATLPSAVKFNSDGTKMYVLDYGSDIVYQYTLSSAYLVSTASYDSVSFNANSQATVARDFVFNANGTKMLILDQTTASVFQYSLATAFDISTASYDSVSFSVISQETFPQGFAFNNTGTTMYIVGIANNTVYQYTTGTTYAPTSQYSPAVTSASGQIDSAFWTDINTMTVDETLNGGNAYYAVSTDNRTTWAVIDDTDGVRPIVRNNAGTWEYNDASTYAGTTWTSATTNEELYALQEALEDGNAESITAYSLSSLTYASKSFSVASQDGNPRSVFFKPDGTKMFVMGINSQFAYAYDLSTAHDVSTASYNSESFDLATSSLELFFKPDGTAFYNFDGTNIRQQNMSTAWDISTASYSGNLINTSAQSTTINAIAFKPDGTKMYLGGTNEDKIFQYSLSTAWDVSTASYDSVFYDNSSITGYISSMVFNDTGTKLFISDRTNSASKIHELALSTAYDISTLSLTTTKDVTNLLGSLGITGIAITNSGLNLYAIGYQTDTVYQYNLGSITQQNRMNSTQLNAVTDPNHYTLGNTLDLAIMLYTASAGSIPTSDGVTINYDAQALNKGAILGTDYDFDFPDSTTVRITSNAAQNLKVRVV